MIQRWALAHERAFLTLFLILVLAALSLRAVEAVNDGWTVEVVAAWVGAFAITALAALVTHRSGRLILRRAEDRAVQRATNRTTLRWTPFIVVAALALAVTEGAVGAIGFAVLGGIFTALAPVLMWVAFVLPPDQQRPDDL